MLHNLLLPHGDLYDAASFVLTGTTCRLWAKLRARSNAKIARIYLQGIEAGREMERQSSGR